MAEDLPWYWGTTTWGSLEGLQPIDDRGMLDQFNFGDGVTHWEVYAYDPMNQVICVAPNDNRIRFILRDDVDQETAERTVFEVADTYFPGILDAYDEQTHAAKIPGIQLIKWEHPNGYDLTVNRDLSEQGTEWEAGLLRDLARRHLISEFYGWGQTARYHAGQYNAGEVLGEYVEADWDAVQTYLDAHYPGYTVQEYQKEDYSEPFYRIVSDQEQSFHTKATLSFALWEQFGLVPSLAFPDEYAPTLSGHNALERRGDVTLDCALSITDVIALNRNLMVGDPLCNTAQKNADIDGDGTPDEADALAILKEIVEITKDFKEP